MNKKYFSLSIITFFSVASLFQSIYTMSPDTPPRDPAVYHMLDSLVPIGQPVKSWKSIFALLDRMMGVIDVNEYTDLEGNTLLISAIKENNFIAAKTLLEKYHADPNMQVINNFGISITPLSMAYTVYNATGDLTMFDLLNHYGAKNF